MIPNKELHEVKFCTLTAESAIVERLERKAAEAPPEPGKRYFCRYCGGEIRGARTDAVAYCSQPCAQGDLFRQYAGGEKKYGANNLAAGFYMGEYDD